MTEASVASVTDLTVDDAADAAATTARPAPGAPRMFLATALTLTALAAVAREAWYRGVEAAAAARVVHAVLGLHVAAARAKQMFFFQVQVPSSGGPSRFMGLGVSLGCSSLLLVLPVLVVTAVLLVAGRTSLLRLSAALAAASAMIVGLNLLRLTLIAFLVNVWGVDAGFGWAHSFFGTLLTLVGLSGAAFAYVAVLRLGRRPGRGPVRPPTPPA